MSHRWNREVPAYWDADKQRVIAAVGHENVNLHPHALGELLGGDWFRVETPDDEVVAYAWMDTTWGDAEIMLAVDPNAQRAGVGKFIIDRLCEEANRRGVNYLFNSIPAAHQKPELIRGWLERRGFTGSEDSRLLRRPARAHSSRAS